ncbi:peptidoglycan/xylan/chitin deacetylase (PgdA/CDA1 family) [Rhodopirellula rubra]|uniref:Peptidoglycan/xylan/chitin deacetylase (PgdA/CDA1 family) n=1 Tax=Aporhodopirellula rubra TaxID=980271 RepID=A0A7W5E4F8_9BACT|nr:polysaccharide deacetylase family protein [Aporhodopirellula rubra]MBB3209913.1 peptidoglycan/xylan/chitin deacetylase (PgdA/CDA1 family) [Aporhodopirellula rubra]
MMTSKAILTTSWDDGHPLDQKLADMLESNGIDATFYIPRQSQLATLGESEVAALSDRFEIGGHTLDHLALTTLSDDETARQVKQCKDWVQDVTGRPCEMFCPPLGKFADADVRCIADAGFRGFRSVELLRTCPPKSTSVVADNGDTTELWELPTSIQTNPHGRVRYLRNTLKRRRVRSTITALMGSKLSDWTSMTERLLKRTIRHGGVFHLWGHSWEIEQNNQWQSLERVLSMLGRHVKNGAIQTMNNTQVCRAFESK